VTPLEFHHIGYACEGISDQLRHFQGLGYQIEIPIFEDPLQMVRGCFMTLGPNRIELLQPTAPNAPLWPYLKKGIQMYHLAYLSPAFDRSLEELIGGGAMQVAKSQPAVAFQGRKISFLMLRNRLLVEIIES
jgi:methylmalonyl-CoA/ethylmalonyl-CoA epimerase